MTSSADIVSTLFAHGMIIRRDTRITTSTNSSTTTLAVQIGCTNLNCKAKKRSSHTSANCYWPGGGKEGQFPPNFGQRSWANAATTNPTPSTSNTQSNPLVLSVLSVLVLDFPGQSGVLIGTQID